MIRPQTIHDLRLPLGHSEADLLALVARQAGLATTAVPEIGYRIIRKSIDARRKGALVLQYSVEVGTDPLALQGIAGLTAITPKPSEGVRPVVVGAGPAGLFAALALALAGQNPLVLEQGRAVEDRQLDVERFWQTGQLDPLSNVQFGEGGAGTFSDGKLTTGIKDPRCRAILEEMVLAGAPSEILCLTRPHVGTDHLRRIVRHIREKIISLGGEFQFNCRLTGLQHAQNHLTGLTCEQGDAGQRRTQEWPVHHLILAVGHSARATFSWLADLPVQMEPKPFSIGVRIEHLQSEIDKSQYGSQAGHPQLPPADYKLACHLPSGRSVYTFCMCPGGQVVAAASESGGVVTNGMSCFARDLANANSGLLVGVDPVDFPEPGPLGGMRWQQSLEQQAYALAGGQYHAPAQRVGQFMLGTLPGRQDDRAANAALQPSYLPGVTWCNLAEILPPVVAASLREALPLLDRRLHGFATPEAILTGLETRSSSPLRIVRDAKLQSTLSGLFPCGEGAGYAGGIMSAAVDGLRCAEAVLYDS